MDRQKVNIKEHNLYLPDKYIHIPNKLGGMSVNDVVQVATELSMHYIERVKGKDPYTFAYPRKLRKSKPDLNNGGFQYLWKAVPRLDKWCEENVAGARVLTIYEPEKAILNDGEGLGEEGIRLLHKLPDAQGVRRRKEYGIKWLNENIKGGENILIAPSGNNIPYLEALSKLPEGHRPKHAVALDYSFKDLNKSKIIASDMGLEAEPIDYIWRNLKDKKGFTRRQLIAGIIPKKVLGSVFMWQKRGEIRGDFDLKEGYFDIIKVDGWFEYWPDEKLANHLGEFLKLLKPGGKLIFDDVRGDKHPSPHFIRTTLGWIPYALRDVDRLHDNVLSRNADAIDTVDIHNVDNVFRMVEITKAESKVEIMMAA